MNDGELNLLATSLCYAKLIRIPLLLAAYPKCEKSTDMLHVLLLLGEHDAK